MTSIVFAICEGQLQNSGKSNVVIIKDCDYINIQKLKECFKCRELKGFIHSIADW